MARLIDADDLEKAIKTDYFEHFTQYHDTDQMALIDMVCEDIEESPTVDAVEVVRCRECKQGEVDDPDFPDQYYCHAGCGWNRGDFYCAYGERKEGAD